MVTKKQIIEALKSSLKRWDKTVKNCPRGGNVYSNWWQTNCNNVKACALCGIFYNGNCVSCPLNDSNAYICSKEWHQASIRRYGGLPIFRNIKAIRDRIQRELDKAVNG